MKRSLILIVVLLTGFFNYSSIAQKMGALKKGVSLNFPEKIQKAVLDPLPAGTYSIGTGGYFATIQSAFDKLSTDGIAGEVVLELIDNLFTAPSDSFGFFLNGPISGAGPNSRVTIKPAANKNVIIEGNGFVTVSLYNANYIIVDGVSITGATTLTIHTLHNAAYIFNDGIDFFNNSDHNVMQNIIFINKDNTRNSGSGFFPWPGSSGAPDSNLIQNNFVKQAGIALYADGYYAPVRAIGNIIRDNIVGSETDSLIGLGIAVVKCQNAIVENNIVQNVKVITSLADKLQYGIQSYWGHGDIIRNNIIHNLRATAGYTSTGILLSGWTSEVGSNNQVYNNMVFDIQNTSTATDSRVTGIQIWYQNNPRIYYNSVYLSGTGTNKYGSAALYVSESCANVDVKDNILVNTRDESPYCASSVYSYNYAILTSDNNDLYYVQNPNNCLVKVSSNNYLTLADWQATGRDLNSITEMPNFIAPDNLHINTLIATYIESGGTPIAGVISDFDGDLRNASTPDIGADEINGIVLPVELTSFTAEALNREVILQWTTATELNNNGFEVQRRVAESDFATVGFVKGEGTTTNQKEYSFINKDLTDGKYFYRLKQVDYNGTYEYSNVIEVDVRSLNDYTLEQNYPNPFNPTTTIGYVLKEKSNAELILLNSIGEEIAVLVNEEQDKGFHKVDFDAVNLPSGVYFYQLKAGNYLNTKKMILLK